MIAIYRYLLILTFCPLFAFANHTFILSSPQTLSVCENSLNYSIDSVVGIYDSISGQTEIWSIRSTPLHGLLTGFNTSLISSGGNLYPTGLFYKPNMGFSGLDSFTIRECNSYDTIYIVVKVAVNSTIGSTGYSYSTINIGNPYKLTDSANGGIWTSSDTTVAVVNDNGYVTGVSLGSVEIRHMTPCFISPDTTIVFVTSPNIYTYAGNGTSGYTGDGGGATFAELYNPNGVAVDNNGNVFIADWGNSVIREVNASGIMSTIAGESYGYGGDGGLAIYANLFYPTDVVTDDSGYIYIADAGNNRIRKIDLSGIITTIAGNGTPGYSGDGGLATMAEINYPSGIAIDSNGNIYIADYYNSCIRMVTKSGIISTIAGNGSFAYTGDGGPAIDATLGYVNSVAVDRKNNVYISDGFNHCIRKVDSLGIINTIAGNGILGNNGDGGVATSAELYFPYGLRVDTFGNLFIADADNSNIREVNNVGIITTIAGNYFGYGGDGSVAYTAEMNYPHGIAVSKNGNIYIADIYNYVVRSIGIAPIIINNPPYFINGYYQSISVCENTTNDISYDLSIIDADAGQTETWSVSSPPANGTVNASYSSTSTGGSITPAGLTYTPSIGFNGTDAFTIQVNDGFTTNYTTINVTVNPIPTITVTPTSPTICYGSDTVLTASGGISYMWNPGTSLSSATSPTVIATPTTTTTYTVTATNANGCVNTDTISVNVSVPPSSPITVDSVQYCQNAVASALTATGTSLLWYTSAAGFGSAVAPIPATATVGSTKYYVTQTISGCESPKDTISVTIKLLPNITVSPSAATICNGGDTTLTPSGGISYSWSPSSEVILSTGVSVIAAPPSTIVYTVSGTGINGCINKATKLVTVNPLPAPITVFGTIITSTCVGHQIRLQDATTGGIWSSGTTSIATINSTGFVTGLDSGVAIITYTNGSTGCYISRQIDVNNDSLHLGTFNTCYGTPIMVDSATLVNWGTFDGMTIGTDNVTFTYSNGGGCEVDYKVITNTLPDYITGNTSVCVGSQDTLANIDSGGRWSSEYPSIATVDSISGVVTGISPGVSYVIFMLPTKCFTTTTITVNPLPILTVTPTNPTICLGKDTILNVSGANTYAWFPPASLNTNSGANVTATPIVNTTYTVTGTDTHGCVSNKSTIVTVDTLPTIFVSPSVDTICKGHSTVLTATGGLSYTWLPSTGLGATTGSSVIANPSSTVIYTVTGTNTNSCSSVSTATVTVNLLPTISISPATFAICIGGDTTLTASGGVSYSWLPATGLSATTGSTVISSVSSTVIYTVTGIGGNGCINTLSKTVTVNPTPMLSLVSNQTVCNNLSTTAVVFSGSVSGTSYNWVNSTASIGLATSGNGTIPSFTANNSGSVAVTATITVTPEANGCGGSSQNFTITVNPTPSVSSVLSQTVCNTTSVSILPFSGSLVSGTSYNWTNSNTSIGLAATGTGSISTFTATNSSTAAATSTITVTPDANSCIGNPQSFAIKVNPTPSIASITSQTVCNTSSVTTISFTGSVTGTTYNWANNNTAIGLAATGTGGISTFTATNGGSAAIISTITATPYANGCSGNPQSFTITVNPAPTVAAITSQAACNNIPISIIPFGGIPVSGFSTSYSWTNSNTSIGLPATGVGSIGTFTPLNSGSSTILSAITVIPEANGCSGTSQTFTITVNPTPSVSPALSQTVCNTSPASTISFSGSPVSGTAYNWTNNNLSIGLAASGTGSIGTFTATNSSSSAVTSIITVTPEANMCNGISQSVTITVNPTPAVASVASQSVCNTASAIPIVFTGPVSGTAYYWTNSNTSIGLAATGTDSIGAFTAANSGSAALTSTITVTPEASSCIGNLQSFTITINPAPSVFGVSSQTVCDNALTSIIYFSGTPVSGFPTTYNWTNSNTSIGLPTTGTDSVVAFTAINGSSVAVTSTITITPSADMCSGGSQSFTITVNPMPTVATVASQTVCNTASTTPLVFAGPVSATTYNWTNSNATIGLAAAGTGNIPSFTAINSGSVAVTAIITVTPEANGCIGSSKSFTITVNPTPSVSPISNQTVCNTTVISTVPFSGSLVSGTAYNWTNNNASIGLAATGVGGIGTFTAANSGIAALTSTITVTPEVNGCIGNSQSFTITINPTPNISAVTSQTVCNTISTVGILFTGSVTATTFTWTNSDTSIGLAATGMGGIAAFTTANSGSVAATATITVTPDANSCNGIPQNFTITVNPAPSVSAIANQTMCDNATTSIISFSGTPVSGFSTSYNWTNSNTSVGLPATGIGPIATFTATNSGTDVISSIITVTPQADMCNGSSQSFTLTVNPMPAVSVVTSQTVCNSAPTDAIEFSGTVSGTVYSWTSSVDSIGLATSGNGTIPSFTATNSGSVAVTATITVTPEANGCSGSSQDFTITVKPTPSVSPVLSQTVCNTVTTTASFSGSPVSGTVYTWTNSNVGIGLGASGTGGTLSFPATNSGSSPITGTVTVTPEANSCIGSSQDFTITINPTPSILPVLSQTVCNTLPVSTLSFSGTSVSGFPTVYNWVNNNTSIGLPASGTGSIGTFTATNSSSSAVTSIVTVTPEANMCNGIPQSFTITINPTPAVAAVVSQSVCNTASATPIVFTGSVGAATYNWTNSNTSIGLAATGTDSIGAFTATNSGIAALTSTITVTPEASGCIGDSQSFTIAVNPAPSVLAITSQTVCDNTLTSIIYFSGTPVSGFPTAYNWTNSNTTIGLPTTGTDSIVAFTAINGSSVAVTSTVTVTPSADMCSGGSQSFTITVNPMPTVATVASQTVCNTASTTPLVFAGPVSATTYNWTNSNATIGLAAAGTGNIPSFTAINSGSVAVTAIITVTPEANGCIGSSKSFTITVNPTPSVSPVSSQTVCNTVGTTASFSGSLVIGTAYSWTNSNIGIGLGASGTSSILSFPATNSGSSAIAGTITVTPEANGCSGGSQNFTITINPTPSVSPVLSQTVCNTVTMTTSFTGSLVSGTVYDWTNSNTSIGLGASGTGSSLSFPATNSGSSAIAVTITVTPEANGCSGSSQNFTIMVNPTPSVSPILSQTVCNTVTTTASFSGSPVSETVYNWTNSNTSIGLSASGTSNTLSFSATNSGSSAITGIITVTPEANGCTGSPQNFTVAVNPTPSVLPVLSQTVCNTVTTTASFSGSPVSGTAYNWTNSNTGIGLAASGTSSTLSFPATNTGSSAITGTISVTPEANGCSGSSQNFIVTVNPTPSVSSVLSQTVCNTVTTTASFSGSIVSGTVYNWANSNTGIGLGASGTSSTLSFPATNSGSSAITGTITVIPEANGCSGNSQNFTITVNPTPSVSPVLSQTVCNTVSTTASFSGSPVSGTAYSWTNSNTGIGLGTSGTGSTISFPTTNGGSSAITGTITVTPEANGCSGSSQNFTITVNPTPSVSPVSSQTVCSTLLTTEITFSGSLVSATSYDWTSSTSSIGIAATGIDSIPSFTAFNSGSSLITGTVTVTPEASGCTGSSRNFTITVNPLPKNITGITSVCLGLTTNLSDSTISGTWSSNNTTLATINTEGVVSGLLAGNDTVIYTLPTGCIKSVLLTINPLPNPIFGVDSVCVGSSTALFDITPSGNWSSSNTTLGTVNTTGLVFGLSAGIDTIIYALPTGCIKSMPVTVNPLPEPLFGDTSVCVGSTIILTDSGGAIAYEIIAVVPGITTVILSTTSACSSHISIVVNRLPAIIEGMTGLCLGTTSVLTDSVTGGTWSSSDTSIANINDTGLVYAMSIGTATITYTLPTGCFKTTTVNVNHLFTITSLEAVNPSTCLGINGSITLSGLGSDITYDVNYLKNGLPDTIMKSSNTTGQLFLDSLSAGIYSDISVSLSGCISNLRDTILVDPPPPSVPVLSDNSPLCAGTNLILNSTDSTAGISYSWTGAAGFTSSLQNTNLSAIEPIDSGYYKLRVGLNNCFSYDSVFVHVISVPIASIISGDSVLCIGATAVLTDSVAGGIWISENSHSTISSLTGIINGVSYGTDTLIYIVSNMCGSDTVKKGIFVNRIPLVDTISGPAFVCLGSTISLIDSTLGGTWSLNNVNATISTTGIVTGVTGGEDSAKYTVVNVCGTTIAKKIVAIIPLPNAGFITGADTLCRGSATNLTDTTIDGIWSSENANATVSADGLVTGITVGTDTIKYSYSNLCGTNVARKAIDVITLPNPGIISGASNVCIGTELLFTDTVMGGTWSNSNANVTINSIGQVNGLLTGVDTIFYSVTNMCGDSIVRKKINIFYEPNSHISIHSEVNACTNTLYQNFGADTAPAAFVKYIWSAVNAEIFASSFNKQNCLVSFNNSGSSTVILTAIDTVTGCYSTDSFKSSVGGGVSPNPEVSYYASIEFVCQDNTANSYQWGFDNKITLDSSLIVGEVNEDYFNTVPDFMDNYYWVMTMHNGCLQKSYYNPPLEAVQTVNENTQILLFPNPANDKINIQIKGISKSKSIDVKLYDISGNTISQSIITGGMGSLNLSGLSSGVYLIMFSIDGVIIGSRTFVKNNG